jgi:hypothetical protein
VENIVRQPHRLNVVGDFYVEDGCCMLCGVPWTIAPDLFEKRQNHCFVKQQPRTPDELARMVEVMRTQDLGCIRYQGRDRWTLEALERVGEADRCDFPLKER